MRTGATTLYLLPSLVEEARALAEAQGVTLDHLINAALAEKLSALRTESYFSERTARADTQKAIEILRKAEKRTISQAQDDEPPPG